MAISARTASLLAQRQGYTPYGSNGRIRLLTPSNNAVASIAKQTANSQLDVMVKNYNAGIVSNQDFKDFLIKMQSNPGLSEVDRADIRNQIADFDQKIQGDKLVANYNAAPDNSLAQLQAAQALSSYYKSRAGSFQPDTPNYIDSINSAGKYDQAIINIQKNINLKAQQNLRYIEEQKVNQIPSNTSQNAMAKAEKWKALYDLAVSQGDEASAQKYAAQYNLETTNAQTLSDKETSSANKKKVSENKKKVSDFINSTINDYHDGKISGEEALSQLQQAEQFAADTNDTNTQLRLNNLAITINREIDKGVVYSSEGGLSQKSKGGGSGGGDLVLNPDGSIGYSGGGTVSGSKGSSKGGTSVGTKVTANGLGSKTSGTTKPSGFNNGNTVPKTLDQLDIEYQNALMDANKALVNGEITADQYMKSLSLLTKSRQVDLQNVTTGLSNILSVNPKAKLGKTEIQTIQDKYTTELGNVTAEHNGIVSGNLVISMGNKSFTDPTGQTINKPALELVQKSDVAKGANVNGIWYKPTTEPLFFANTKSAQSYIENNSIQGATVVKNASGGYSVQNQDGSIATGDVVHVTDTGGNSVAYQNEGSYGYLPLEVGPKTAALRQKILTEADAAKKAGVDYQPKLMNFHDITTQDLTPIPTKLPPKPGAIQQTVDSIVKPVSKAVESVTPPAIIAPIRAAEQNKTSSELNIPSNVSIPTPTFQSTQPTATGVTKAVAPKTTQLAGTPIAPALKQAINPTGSTPIKIAAPPPTVSKTPAVPPKDQYSVGNNLKKLVSNLTFGLLKF